MLCVPWNLLMCCFAFSVNIYMLFVDGSQVVCVLVNIVRLRVCVCVENPTICQMIKPVQ
jgi:hypothetical protein